MTAYNSLEIAQRYPVSGVGMGGRMTHRARGFFDVATAGVALATGDVVALFNLPIRARIVDGFIKSDTLGAGASFNVGDAANPSRYFNGSAIGVAGGVDRGIAATGMDYLTPTKGLVSLTLAGGAAATTGQIVVHLVYINEEPA